MNEVFIIADQIISPLGFNTEENVSEIMKNHSGISLQANGKYTTLPFYASVINDEVYKSKTEAFNDLENHTKLEQLMFLSIQELLSKYNLAKSNKLLVLVSTTKGNVELLSKMENKQLPEKAYLSSIANQLQHRFGFVNKPVIVSNACVSGLLAISVAKRMIKSGRYDHALVVGGDVVSEFIVSGFNSFHAISDEPCRPFSKNRKGITIGEAVGSVLLSSDKELVSQGDIKILGDSSCNDANHISGPSRTGEGLYRSIRSTLKEAKTDIKDIDYLSAHGTATLYNDEMEAIAFNRVGLDHVPVNSLKGYYGHTLGASGLIEAIIGIHSLKHNMLYKSLGFDELGVSEKINVIKGNVSVELNTFLKTASGFGGCNTTMMFQKV